MKQLSGGSFAGWWYRPEFIINELNINAAISSPGHDDIVPLTMQPYTVRGYAYTGALFALGQFATLNLHKRH